VGFRALMDSGGTRRNSTSQDQAGSRADSGPIPHDGRGPIWMMGLIGQIGDPTLMSERDHEPPDLDDLGCAGQTGTPGRITRPFAVELDPADLTRRTA